MQEMPRHAVKTARPKPEARPRTKPAEVRREELLDAAEKLFLAKGLAATSVDEIVGEADVAKGTFYLHFASKEALLLGLQERFVARFCINIDKTLARKRADDWKGRLRAWVQTTLTTYLDNVALHDLVFHEFQDHQGHHRHDFKDNPVMVFLSTLLAQGSEAGAFSVSDPELTAVMLFHAMHGAADAAVMADNEPARKNIARTLEAFFMRAVGA